MPPDVDNPHWVRDCLMWRGKVLTGGSRHWCDEWDSLPIDDTCLEWPCGCEPDLKALNEPPLP